MDTNCLHYDNYLSSIEVIITVIICASAHYKLEACHN